MKYAFLPAVCRQFSERSLFRALLSALFMLLPAVLGAQGLYDRYISQYSSMAVDQMNRYGVPASITLAQGLLESAAGTSTLAVKANNHFGIKVGGDWSGPYMLRDDDAPNERFRKYRSVAESYEDHSLFLRNRSRYAALFRLSPSDYKGWAHGLKNAGYATHPHYARRLIEIIERYDLTRFDRGGKTSRHHRGASSASSAQQAASPASRPVLRCNGVYYVVARSGDTFRSIAREMKTSERKLRRYNELPKPGEPKAGEPVYLTKKKSRADRSFRRKPHVVAAGESMYSISQRYAVRLKKLYDLNDLPATYVPKPGDRIRVR
ncbi:MAG: glucosaminidase domain-containing protein [Prevotellaceae bacterium]|nr:glucosaminidase domain-containing protein [Prevotellaceae bacterium]